MKKITLNTVRVMSKDTFDKYLSESPVISPGDAAALREKGRLEKNIQYKNGDWVQSVYVVEDMEGPSPSSN